MSSRSFDFPRVLRLANDLRQAPATASVPASVPPDDPSAAPARTRQDRLDAVLGAACSRGGFTGAALADASGLLLSLAKSPVAPARLEGLTAVLSETLERVARLWEGPRPDNLSLDVDYSDKLVFRTFQVDSRAYCLMVFCAQEVDERSELELAVGAVTQVIRGR